MKIESALIEHLLSDKNIQKKVDELIRYDITRYKLKLVKSLLLKFGKDDLLSIIEFNIDEFHHSLVNIFDSYNAKDIINLEELITNTFLCYYEPIINELIYARKEQIELEKLQENGVSYIDPINGETRWKKQD